MSSRIREWKGPQGNSRRSGSRPRARGNAVSRSSTPGTTDINSHHTLDSKPREEKDFKEFYPDLDSEKPMKVFIVASSDDVEPEQINDARVSELKKPVYKAVQRLPSETRFGKKLLSLGYRNPQSGQSRISHDVYIRPDYSINTLTNNTLTKDDKFQVMYDMDEQDTAFIDLINEQKHLELPYEILEIAFTFLEREWYLLEKILPPKRKPFDSMNSDEMIDKTTQHTSIYGSDDGSGGRPEEDQCCAVCNESECDNSNAIVFCDGCDIAVHQECYGVVFIPEGQWLCRRCLISRNNKSACLFCPSKTGAFKQTEHGSWCHVICALWISELYFANPIYMEPVEGLDLIPKSRWRLNCYICRQKMGACIQCSNRNCFQAYHVTCARRSELYMRAKEGTQHALSNPESLVSYCDKHGPAAYTAQHDVRTGIEKTRLYFATIGAIKDKASSFSFSSSSASGRGSIAVHKTSENPFRWKSDLDTPIAPESFARRLKAFLDELQLAAVPLEVVYALCSYWSLKREYKRGAALIKRLDAPQYGQLSSVEIDDRVKFLGSLTADVEKLCELADFTARRTRVQAQLIEFKLGSMDLVYFPVNYIIQQLLAQIVDAMDKNGSLSAWDPEGKCLSFTEIRAKVDTYAYKSVEEFIEEFKILMETVVNGESDQHLGATVKKLYHKWQKKLGMRFKAALALEASIKEKLAQGNSTNLVDDLSKDVFEINGTNVGLQKWEGIDIATELTDVEEVDEFV